MVARALRWTGDWRLDLDQMSLKTNKKPLKLLVIAEMRWFSTVRVTRKRRSQFEAKGQREVKPLLVTRMFTLLLVTLLFPRSHSRFGKEASPLGVRLQPGPSHHTRGCSPGQVAPLLLSDRPAPEGSQNDLSVPDQAAPYASRTE